MLFVQRLIMWTNGNNFNAEIYHSYTLIILNSIEKIFILLTYILK